MAERRAAGFNIPLNFYDGPEVESIPKRIRAAAIGVWGLAGNYAATQLTDGYVGAGLLKQFGCTDAIRAALKVTINKRGELSPLWIEARDGGVQLTNWPKHQRTSDEVTTYRESEADRKRREREAKRAAREAKDGTTNASSSAVLTRTSDGTSAYLIDNIGEDATNVGDENRPRVNTGRSSTSANRETSGRTMAGQPADVRPDDRDPKTETETETSNGHLESAAYESDGARERDDLSPPVNVGATRLVQRAIPARAVNDATRTGLRIEASQLLGAGETETDVDACLRLWLTKPGLGVKALKSLMAEVYKTRNGATAAPQSKVRTLAEMARQARAAEQTQLVPADRKALT